MKYSLKSVLNGHASAVYCLYHDLEEERLYSGSSDRMVGSWDLNSATADLFSVKLNAAVFSLMKVNNFLLIGQAEGGVHVVDLSTKSELRHLKYHSKPIFEILKHRSQPFFYFLGGDGVLSIVSSLDYSLKWSLPLSEDKLRSGIFDDSGKHLLIGGSDGFIRCLETEYYNELWEFKAHEGGVYDMKWISEKRMVSAGRDGHIRIWEYRENQLFEDIAIPAHNYAIYSIDLSPCGKFMATASRDKTAKVWDFENLKKPLRIARKGPIGHSHSVNVVRWIDEDTVATAGDDRSIYLWAILKP